MQDRLPQPSPTAQVEAISNDEVNKYGIPAAKWALLTPKQRQYYYRKHSEEKLHDQNRARRLLAYANMTQEEKVRLYAKNKAFRLANLDKKRGQDRKHSRAHYWRTHEKQLERCRVRWAKARSKRTVSLSPDTVFSMIDKAVSKVLPRFVRDDVIAAMCLAVIEGNLFVENIPKEAAKFLSAYNREYDHFKTISLDAPVRGSDGFTLLDRLSDQDTHRGL